MVNDLLTSLLEFVTFSTSVKVGATRLVLIKKFFHIFDEISLYFTSQQHFRLDFWCLASDHAPDLSNHFLLYLTQIHKDEKLCFS